MPTLTSSRSWSGVVFFFLSAVCSPPSALWLVEAFPDKPQSAPSVSRNKRGRISSPDKLEAQKCRGGSLSTTSTEEAYRRKRIRRRLRQDRELDEYINFLIEVYCLEDEEVPSTATVDTASTATTTECSGARAVHLQKEAPSEQADAAKDQEEVTVLHVGTTPQSEKSVHLESGNTPKTLNDTVFTGGGGDDDDDDETEDEEVLDRYIEFLQEDYENDRALDRYIDFLQQDYDADQALDGYIDFLLATTTATVANPPEGEVIAAVHTNLPPNAEEVVVLDTTQTEQQPEILLDDYYMDRVTAVELDTYIDRLVESRSDRREEEEELTQQSDVELREHAEEIVVENEQVSAATLDSYIDSLVSSAEEEVINASPEDSKASPSSDTATETSPTSPIAKQSTGDVEGAAGAALDSTNQAKEDVEEVAKIAVDEITLGATKEKASLSSSGGDDDGDGEGDDQKQPKLAEKVAVAGDDEVVLDKANDASSLPSQVETAEAPKAEVKPKKKRKKKAKAATAAEVATAEDGQEDSSELKEPIAVSALPDQLDVPEDRSSSAAQGERDEASSVAVKPKKKRKKKAKAVAEEVGTAVEQQGEPEDSAEMKEPVAVWAVPLEEGDDLVDEAEGGNSPAIQSDSDEALSAAVKPKKKREKTMAVAEETSTAFEEQDELVATEGEPVAADAAPVEQTKAAEDEDEESQDVEPLLAPNGLYRFLLGKGPVGHILVLAIVLVVEWVQLYVPQLAEFLALVWTKIAPGGLQRRMAPQRITRGGEGSSSAKLQHLYSGRMPVKGRDRRKLSKKADEEALELLKTVGDIQDTKYKHVSVSFLQRHGLGPYRDERSDDDEIAMFVPQSRKKVRASKKKRDVDGDDGEESDVDWVLDSLLDDKPTKTRRPKSPVDTSVSFGMGPKGPVAEVGVQFGLGGKTPESRAKRKSTRRRPSLDAASIARDSVRKKKAGPRPSDRDGGSGFMGMVRAAATSNNLMSRSLLGAYPGDAAPLEQSADARGVSNLASKYGYGDWSEDDEDSDAGNDRNSFRKKSGKTKKRKLSKNKVREETSYSNGDTFDLASLVSDAESDDAFGLGSLGSDAPAILAPRGTSKKRRSTTSKSSTSASGRDKKRKIASPSLSTLDKAKSQRKRKPKVESTKASGIEEMSKRAKASKKQKMVRPTLHRLKEVEEKPRKSSKAPGELE